MSICAIIDPRLPEKMKESLRQQDIYVIPVSLTDSVAEPICGHPDIQMFLHEKNLFVHPEIDSSFLKKIETYVNIIICPTKLTSKYPGDIPYNIACTGKYALHNKKYTEKKITEYLTEKNISLINTNQAYTRCSTLIVDDRSIITSDVSINKESARAGLDSLLISPGFIELPGYNYGFIGGASGKFYNTIYFSGSIDSHPDYNRIRLFIESKNKQLQPLSDQPLFDSGSIMFVE